MSETLDLTSAIMALNMRELEPEVIDDTLSIILKYQDDIEAVRGKPARRPFRCRWAGVPCPWTAIR